MQHFQKAAVDRTDRQAMISFLAGHYRYDTMNSWNRATSYAHCVKIHALGLDREQTEKAFELLNVDYWDDLSLVIEDFVVEMNGEFTISSNGRSSGYLVLMKANGNPPAISPTAKAALSAITKPVPKVTIAAVAVAPRVMQVV